MGKVLVNETDLIGLANDLRMNITGNDLALAWPTGFRTAAQNSSSSGGSSGVHTLTVSPNSFNCINEYHWDESAIDSSTGGTGSNVYDGFWVGPMTIQYDGTTVTTGALVISGEEDVTGSIEANQSITNVGYWSYLGEGQHTVYILYNGLYTTVTINVTEQESVSEEEPYEEEPV